MMALHLSIIDSPFSLRSCSSWIRLFSWPSTLVCCAAAGVRFVTLDRGDDVGGPGATVFISLSQLSVDARSGDTGTDFAGAAYSRLPTVG